MSVTYQQATPDQRQYVSGVLRECHGDLHDAGAKFDLLLAYGPRNKQNEQTGPAIKINGRECAACVRVLGLRDRAAGRADFEVLLNGDRVGSWSVGKLKAIVDHVR